MSVEDALQKLDAFRKAGGASFPEAEARAYVEAVFELSREDRCRFLREAMELG